jgi:hypothetical protein
MVQVATKKVVVEQAKPIIDKTAIIRLASILYQIAQGKL